MCVIFTLIAASYQEVFNITAWLNKFQKNHDQDFQLSEHMRYIVSVPCRAGYKFDGKICRKTLKQFDGNINYIMVL